MKKNTILCKMCLGTGYQPPEQEQGLLEELFNDLIWSRNKRKPCIKCDGLGERVIKNEQELID